MAFGLGVFDSLDRVGEGVFADTLRTIKSPSSVGAFLDVANFFEDGFGVGLFEVLESLVKPKASETGITIPMPRGLLLGVDAEFLGAHEGCVCVLELRRERGQGFQQCVVGRKLGWEV